MPQASITINSVPGSSTSLPINTLVQLDNQNIGGELSYRWEILDQPPGAADALSSGVIQNPTFTPRKEGTYLLKLTVNEGLVTEQQQTVVAAVVQLKTLQRIPAAGEVLEADVADGWATAMNALLRRVDDLLSDPGVMVGVNASGGTLTRGQVVRAATTAVIKSGLPGQETVPGFSLATAAALGQIDELLAVVEGTPSGGTSVPGTGSAEARLMRVRYIGRISGQVIAGGPVAAGDVIFVNDAGALAAAQGTIRRRVGSAMGAGSTVDVWFNGVGGADIDLTPIDRAYVVLGNPGALPNAVRVDGSSASLITTPFRLRAGNAGTVPLQVQAFAGGANLTQWLDAGGGLLARVLVDGTFLFDAGTGVVFNSSAQNIDWPDFRQRTYLLGGVIPTWEVGDRLGSGNFLAFAAINIPFSGVSALLIGETPGLTSSELRHLGTGGLAISTGAGALSLGVGGFTLWQVTAAGALEAVGGNRLVRNVQNPALAQDAATKVYVDDRDNVLRWNSTQQPYRNLLINSGFDFWQRGTTRTATQVSVGGNRVQAADRWALAASRGPGSGSVTVTMEQQANTGLFNNNVHPLVARVSLTALPSAPWMAALIQEVDRSQVRRARGRRLILTLRATADANFSGQNVQVSIVTGTGADTQNVFSGYTGAATLHSSNFTIFTGANSLTILTTATVPTDATTMAVQFTTSNVVNPTQPATPAYFELAELMLTDVDSDAAGATGRVWERAGGSLDADLRHCLRYLEKSNDLASAMPGGVQVYPTGPVAPVLTLAGNSWPIVQPRFLVRKFRAPPSVSIWDGSNNANQWTLDVNRATAVAQVSEVGFLLTNNTGGSVTPAAAGFSSGQWLADAEI